MIAVCVLDTDTALDTPNTGSLTWAEEVLGARHAHATTAVNTSFNLNIAVLLK